MYKPRRNENVRNIDCCNSPSDDERVDTTESEALTNETTFSHIVHTSHILYAWLLLESCHCHMFVLVQRLASMASYSSGRYFNSYDRTRHATAARSTRRP